MWACGWWTTHSLTHRWEVAGKICSGGEYMLPLCAFPVLGLQEEAHFNMHSTYKAVIAGSEAKMDHLSQVSVVLRGSREAASRVLTVLVVRVRVVLVARVSVFFFLQEVASLKDTIRQLTLAQSFSKAPSGAGGGAGSGGPGGGVTSPSPAGSTPGRRHRSSSINASVVVRGGVEVAPTPVGGVIIRKIANPVPKS